MPTETVYGLAADAANDRAVAEIYALKGRPSFNPLIAHMADIAMAKRYVHWNAQAQLLAEHYWPGALTLVLPLRADAAISPLATDGGQTLAVRVPDHPITKGLIAALGKPIVAPSANRSGRISPTRAEHVGEEFAEHGEKGPWIVDGGPCQMGLESTVLDITGNAPVLLRAGGVTVASLEKLLGTSVARYHAFIPEGAKDAALRSPGMLSRHYAPDAKLRLQATVLEKGEALLAFGPALPGASHVFNLSPSGDMLEAAANLFTGLRTLDASANAIAVMPIPNTGIGEAINDRLARAAVR